MKYKKQPTQKLVLFKKMAGVFKKEKINSKTFL